MTQQDVDVDLSAAAEMIRSAKEALCSQAGAAMLPSSTGFASELTSAISMVDGGRKLLLNVLGWVKAGKTAVLNGLIGAQALPSSTQPQTALPVMILFEAGRSVFRLRSLAAPEAEGDGEEASRRLRFDNYATTDHVCTEGTAKQVREAVEELTRRIRAASATQDSPTAGEAEKAAATAVLESITLLELTCPTPEWLSRVPTAILEQLCFMDTPGRGEMHASHVQELADKCLYEADILIPVCDYTKLMTETAREMFQVGAVCRPDLTGNGSGSQRTLILVNRIDIRGMGSTSNEVACETAQRLAMTEMKLQEAPDAFPISALHKNRSFGYVEGDPMVENMLRGSSRKYPTFRMSVERLRAYNWARLGEKSGFTALEDRLLHLATVELPSLSVATAKSQAGVALASWHRSVVKMLEDLNASASERQQEAANLRALKENLNRLISESVEPFVAGVGEELRQVSDQLRADVNSHLERAENACKQLVKGSVFEKKGPAEDYARMCFSTIVEALLRSLESARAATAAKVTTVLRKASQNAVTHLWPDLKTTLSKVLGPEPLERCKLLLTGRLLTEELERLRDTIVAPVMAPRGLINDELKNYVSSHAFTVQKQRIVTSTKTVSVGFFFWKKNISFPTAEVQNYEEKAVNYPVVVTTMTGLARNLIQALAEERASECSRVLGEEVQKFQAKMRDAITTPVEEELERLEVVIQAQLAGKEEVTSRCNTLQQFKASIEEHQRIIGYEHLNGAA